MAGGCCLGGGWACACNGLVAGASVVAGVGCWGASLWIRTRAVSRHVRYPESNREKKEAGIGPSASGDGGVMSGRVRASPRRRWVRSVSVRKYTHVDQDPFASARHAIRWARVRGVPVQLSDQYMASVAVRATSAQGRGGPLPSVTRWNPTNFVRAILTDSNGPPLHP